jgi:hypothetical protein
MALQKYRNSENVLVGPYGEMYPASQAWNIKAEEVSDAQEEVDPGRKTIEEIKAEHEVSCMFLYVQFSRYQKYAEMPIFFLISICLAG